MKRYPLSALFQARQAVVRQKESELLGRQKSLAEAEARLQSARARKHEEQEQESEVLHGERRRAGTSGVSAADLQQLAQYRMGVQEKLTELERHTSEQRKKLAAARSNAERAQRELGRAHVEEASVAADRERYLAEQRRRLEAAQEDEAQDQHAARAVR